MSRAPFALQGLLTVEELRREASERLGRIGVVLPAKGLRAIASKRGEEFPPDALLSSVCRTGDVVQGLDEGRSQSAAIQTVAFVRVSHPALRDGIALFVSLAGLSTIADIEREAQRLLQQTEPALTVASLETSAGQPLDSRCVPALRQKPPALACARAPAERLIFLICARAVCHGKVSSEAARSCVRIPRLQPRSSAGVRASHVRTCLYAQT